MFLPTGNVRLGLLFELGARFNLERPANLSEKPGSIRPRQTGSRSEERSTWNGQPFVKTMARAFSSSRLFDGTDFNLTA